MADGTSAILSLAEADANVAYAARLAVADAMRERGEDEAAAEDAGRGAGERAAEEEEDVRDDDEANVEGEGGPPAVAAQPKLAYAIGIEMGLTPEFLDVALTTLGGESHVLC